MPVLKIKQNGEWVEVGAGVSSWNDLVDRPAIIDVTELPTENINEQAFYRVVTGSLVFDQSLQDTYTVHCVETLPESGLPATNIDQTEGNIYYNVSNGEAYGYIDEILSTGLNAPSGWYPLATLLEALGFEYSGVITNILDDPEDDTFRILLKFVIYDYKNGNWTSHETSHETSHGIIGWVGTGQSAEIFNNPANVASGDWSHAEGYNTTASGECSHAEGSLTTASSYNSHAEGYNTTASGNNSHAEGYSTTASGHYSHAEGEGTSFSLILTGDANSTTYTYEGSDNDGIKVGCVVSLGDVYTTIVEHNADTSTIVLKDTLSAGAITGKEAKLLCGVASGYYSHAEGYNTTASGGGSHAEGGWTTASGGDSHAEGWCTTASGNNSHAEGRNTTASGYYSHAEGYHTIAASSVQHVQGRYNIADTPDATGIYAHIVGNGTGDSNRSNAHTLDWNGNAWFAGTVKIGADNKELATKEYVEMAVGMFEPKAHTHTNASLGQGWGACSTSSSTTEKAVSISNYALTTGGIVTVYFHYDVPASATLNVSSKGAKPIHFQWDAIAANIIKGGDTATFIYDGSYYNLLSVDRWHDDIVSLKSNDSKVRQMPSTANGNFRLLLTPSSQSADTTAYTYFDNDVYLNPYYNKIYGVDISGNAGSADKLNTAPVSATLSASSWSNLTQTVSVSGVTASNTVIITPAPSSHTSYCASGVYCSAQASGTLTFTCAEKPTSALTVNVLILN